MSVTIIRFMPYTNAFNVTLIYLMTPMDIWLIMIDAMMLNVYHEMFLLDWLTFLKWLILKSVVPCFPLESRLYGSFMYFITFKVCFLGFHAYLSLLCPFWIIFLNFLYDKDQGSWWKVKFSWIGSTLGGSPLPKLPLRPYRHKNQFF